jgi:hypothetical protein
MGNATHGFLLPCRTEATNKVRGFAFGSLSAHVLILYMQAKQPHICLTLPQCCFCCCCFYLPPLEGASSAAPSLPFDSTRLLHRPPQPPHPPHMCLILPQCCLCCCLCLHTPSLEGASSAAVKAPLLPFPLLLPIHSSVFLCTSPFRSAAAAPNGSNKVWCHMSQFDSFWVKL